MGHAFYSNSLMGLSYFMVHWMFLYDCLHKSFVKMNSLDTIYELRIICFGFNYKIGIKSVFKDYSMVSDSNKFIIP